MISHENIVGIEDIVIENEISFTMNIAWYGDLHG